MFKQKTSELETFYSVLSELEINDDLSKDFEAKARVGIANAAKLSLNTPARAEPGNK